MMCTSGTTWSECRRVSEVVDVDTGLRACRSFHGSLPATHPPSADCVSCHMPQRQAEDAIQITIMDHKIQRPAVNTATQCRHQSATERGARWQHASLTSALHGLGSAEAARNQTEKSARIVRELLTLDPERAAAQNYPGKHPLARSRCQKSRCSFSPPPVKLRNRPGS
jgi:hypothetical protein